MAGWADGKVSSHEQSLLVGMKLVALFRMGICENDVRRTRRLVGIEDINAGDEEWKRY